MLWIINLLFGNESILPSYPHCIQLWFSIQSDVTIGILFLNGHGGMVIWDTPWYDRRGCVSDTVAYEHLCTL